LKNIKVGANGGTGMQDLFGQDPKCRVEKLTERITPYGGPVIYYRVTREVKPGEAVDIYFLSRHLSSGVYLLPHELEWQAYMYTLLRLVGVDCILGTSAVGAIYYETGGYRQGDIIAPRFADDYIGDPYTFEMRGFSDKYAFHRPSEWLLCPYLQGLLAASTTTSSTAVWANSVRGPRFETGRQIQRRKRDGVHLVGMPTAFPEAVLAGEGAVPYGLLCGVSNMAPAKHSGRAVGEVMAEMQEPMLRAILDVAYKLTYTDTEHPLDCPCRQDREKSVFDILGDPS
jgi:purine nucleoside phosphorylase